MTTKVEMRPSSREEAKALRGVNTPPAYGDIMISVDPKADLLVTARTPKGKTAYFYSKAFIERQVAKKWRRVAKLTEQIDGFAERVTADSEDAGCADRACAMTIRLIMQTAMRNGNAAQGDKETYGASSLRMEHVQVDGKCVLLHFPGKHGVEQDFEVVDAVLADYVREREGLGAETLFPHVASDTLRYWRSVAGRKVKVHDIRTWYANVLAQALVAQHAAAAPSLKKLKKQVAEGVAAKLGNKPGQALKSYINPRVFGEEV